MLCYSSKYIKEKSTVNSRVHCRLLLTILSRFRFFVSVSYFMFFLVPGICGDPTTSQGYGIEWTNQCIVTNVKMSRNNCCCSFGTNAALVVERVHKSTSIVNIPIQMEKIYLTYPLATHPILFLHLQKAQLF